MEKFPNISFLGKTSEETIRKKTEKYERFLTEDHRLSLSEEKRHRLGEIEIAKSPEETRLFVFADTWSKDRQEICGVKPHDFPIRNIFLTTPEGYREISPHSQGSASADMKSQRVVAIADGNTYELTRSIFHEITHCKGRIVVELEESDRDENENIIRAGIGVYSTLTQDRKGGRHSHFRGLEEAVVAQEEIHFGSDLLRRPEFQKQREAMTSETGRKKQQEILRRKNLSEDDLSSFDPETGEVWATGYIAQRRVLQYVCQEIATQTKSTDNEVYFQFLKSHFTGHLVGIARLVEEAFGKGSFRRLGDMGNDKDSAIQTLEALKKMRASVLKAFQK
jgi:hypothetical protein